jgi:TolB protein
MLAFVSLRDGTSRIWLKQLAGGGEASLTEGPDHSPRFSPDGNSLLFVRVEEGVGSVYRTALVGGRPRRLIEDAYEVDPSPDGERVAFLRARGDAGAPENLVMLANADGSGERQLYAVMNHVLYGVRWSPDGTRIALTERPPVNTAASRVLVVDVETGGVNELANVPPDVRPTSVVWSRDGRELVYAWTPALAAELPVAKVVAHEVATGLVRGLFWARDLDGSLDVPTPGTIVFGARSRRQNLRLVSLEGSAAEQILTLGNSVDRQPVFSPDGRTLVFSSSRSGNLDLWTVDVATGEVSRLTDDEAADWDPAFSPDGERVLWSSGRSGNLEIWMARADGSGARQVTRDGVDAENPTMTADGQWIVYSTTNPDQLGLHRIRPDGSDDERLVADTCFLPEVSPDGRHALYLVADPVAGRNVIRVVEVPSGEPVDFEILLDLPSTDTLGGNYGRARWLPDGSAVAFVAADETGQYGVQVQEFAPGRDTAATRRTLVELEPGSVIESFGLSRDGRMMVVSTMVDVASLVMAENVPGVSPARR